MTGAQRRTSGVSRGRIHKSHDSWLRARAGLAPLSGARSPLASKAWLSRLIPPNPGLRFPPPTSQPASPISRPFLTHRGPNRSPPTTREPLWRACALRCGRSLPGVSAVRFWGRWLQAPSPHPGFADLKLHFPPTTGPRLNFAVLGSV